jgi:hypothetical protein
VRRPIYWLLALAGVVLGLYFLQLFVMNVWLSATPSPEDISQLRLRAYASLGIAILCFAGAFVAFVRARRAK